MVLHSRELNLCLIIDLTRHHFLCVIYISRYPSLTSGEKRPRRGHNKLIRDEFWLRRTFYNKMEVKGRESFYFPFDKSREWDKLKNACDSWLYGVGFPVLSLKVLQGSNKSSSPNNEIRIIFKGKLKYYWFPASHHDHVFIKLLDVLGAQSIFRVLKIFGWSIKIFSFVLNRKCPQNSRLFNFLGV